ncbi:MAG: AzlC family ABC transporter permease [Lachnospiraceae bacterium]|nr:AzlC family ABC transporter permease [Lachnospiraceae bacterium]
MPIGAGYFAVSFSLGITASLAGVNAIQGFIASLFTLASAGEYAGFTTMAAGGSYVEMALMCFIASARYLLMACALSQRMSENLPFRHRLGIGFCLTDEIFGISIAKHGPTDPFYMYGAVSVAAPLWALGTSLGIVMGNLLPGRIVSALSVSLYGMFLAIIIPPARKNKVVAALVLVSFALSYCGTYIPFIKDLSSGTRTIILTLVIASVFALLFPVKEEKEEKTA